MRSLLLAAALAVFASACAEDPAEAEAPVPVGEAEVVTEPEDDLAEEDLLPLDAPDDLDVADSTLVEGEMGDAPAEDL